MIFLYLVLFQAKHFVCDYLLQTEYMLGKFKPAPDYILPLFIHSLIHGVTTYLIVFCVQPDKAAPLACVDMCLHFVIDRIKASPELLGKFKPLTADQYGQARNMSKGLHPVSDSIITSMDSQTMAVYKEAGQRDLDSNKYFWYSLGGDQAAHHLTHYFIIYMMMRGI